MALRSEVHGRWGRCLASGAACALIAACGTSCTSVPMRDAQPDAVRPAACTLRVLTLNIAHGRGTGPNQVLRSGQAFRPNLDAVAGVLRRERPDAAALQEADGPSWWSGDFDHVAYLAGKAGFEHSFRGEHAKTGRPKLSYGTALLLSTAPAGQKSVAFSQSRLTPSKGYVVCTIDWPGRDGVQVDVVSVHLDFAWGAVRARQVQQMANELGPRGRPLIVMGDFNCEWQWQEPTLRTLAEGLRLRAFKPEAEDMDTFPKLSRRLDWVLISPELEFISYRVLPDVVSDHRAVVAEVQLTDGGKETE